VLAGAGAQRALAVVAAGLQLPSTHWYQLPSWRDCTQVREGTERPSVEELQ
jgi:hypothetical protein